MQKWMLLGATGQLGSEWKHFITENNIPVDLQSYNSTELDITDNEKIEQLIAQEQPTVIVNCAAYTHVDLAEKDYQKAMDTNFKAVEYLALACKKYDVRLIHYSTDFVFNGSKEERNKYSEGFKETHVTESINWYGKSKLRGEKAIQKSGCEHLIIRLSWLCGAYGHNFVTTMIQLGKERDTVEVVDDQWGSPTYTAHVVENTWVLIQNNKEGVYHLTSNGVINWATFAKEIFQKCGLEVEVVSIPSAQFETEAKRPTFSKLNTQKIEQIEGIHIVDWKQGLAELLNQLGR